MLSRIVATDPTDLETRFAGCIIFLVGGRKHVIASFGEYSLDSQKPFDPVE